MRKLLPILLALVGLLAGGGAGLMLRPAHEEMAADTCAPPTDDAGGHETKPKDSHDAEAGTEEGGGEGGGEGEVPTKEFVKLNNQFIVPVVKDEKVSALVILSISLEVKGGSTQSVYNFEPKLRDSFLKVLFDHANAGGFDGAFTNSNNMEILRIALLDAAVSVLGERVNDILITDIVRQDN